MEALFGKIIKSNKRTYKPRSVTSSKKVAKESAFDDEECDKEFFHCFQESEDCGKELRTFTKICSKWIQDRVQRYEIDSLEKLMAHAGEGRMTRFQYCLFYFYGPLKIDFSQPMMYKAGNIVEQYDLNQGFSEIPGTIYWKSKDQQSLFKISMGRKIKTSDSSAKSLKEEDSFFPTTDVTSKGKITHAWCMETDILHPKSAVWFPKLTDRIICFPERWLEGSNAKNVEYIKEKIVENKQTLSKSYYQAISKPYNASITYKSQPSTQSKEEESVKISFLCFKIHCPEYSDSKIRFLQGTIPDDLKLDFSSYDKAVISVFAEFTANHSIPSTIESQELVNCLCFGIEVGCKSFVFLCLELWMCRMIACLFKDFASFEHMWIKILRWEEDEMIKPTLKPMFDHYVSIVGMDKFLHLWHITEINEFRFREHFASTYLERYPLGLNLSLMETCTREFGKDESFIRWLFLSVMFRSHPDLKQRFISAFDISE